jgi:hypothetical protein
LAAGASLLMASSASACWYANQGHCYAISEWEGVKVELTLIDADTIESSVPEQAGYYGPESEIPPRVQDEEWTGFNSSADKTKYDGWIEAGDTTGGTPAGFKASPIYFEASNSWYYPNLQKVNYTEVDFPGPGPGSGWWDAITYTEESGSWCASIEESELFCFPGLERYGNRLTDGLEYAANNDPSADEGWYARNQAEVIGYDQNSAGEVTQWLGAHLQYADEQEGDPWPPAGAWGVCGSLNAKSQGNGAIRVEAPAWIDWGECSPGPIRWSGSREAEEGAADAPSAEGSDLPTLAAPQPSSAVQREQQTATRAAAEATSKGGEATAILESFDAPTPTAPAPLAGYVAPTSQPLSRAAILARASAIARKDTQDAEASYLESLEDVSLAEAVPIASPGATDPTEPSPEVAEWLKSETDIVVENGSFTIAAAAGGGAKASEATVSGKYLTLVMDRHSGAVDAVRISSAKPKKLKKL